MKKIMALVLMLMMFCQVCTAFEQPNPDRWRSAGSNDEVEYWVDSYTAKFSKESYGKSANIWVLTHVKKSDLESVQNDSKILQNLEIDLDGRRFKVLTASFYGDNGKVEHTIDNPSSKFEPFLPDTIGENLYIAVLMLYALQIGTEHSDALQYARDHLGTTT